MSKEKKFAEWIVELTKRIEILEKEANDVQTSFQTLNYLLEQYHPGHTQKFLNEFDKGERKITGKSQSIENRESERMTEKECWVCHRKYDEEKALKAVESMIVDGKRYYELLIQCVMTSEDSLLAVQCNEDLSKTGLCPVCFAFTSTPLVLYGSDLIITDDLFADIEKYFEVIFQLKNRRQKK